jgi:RimJ/RimL family protein N-acetyltransferase
LHTARVPQLESDRLRLRPWRESDVDAYLAIARDPAVARQMGSGLRYALKRAAASLVARFSNIEARRAIAGFERHWTQCGFGEWAVEEKACADLIGKIGLVHHPDWPVGPAKVEIGWTIAQRAWGQGLATEGATTALDYAFRELELDRVISITRRDNTRSLRVMEKLGLRPQGTRHWHGSDMVWYAIDRGDWLSHDQSTAMTAER